MSFIQELKQDREFWRKQAISFPIGSAKHTEIKGIVAEFDQFIAEESAKSNPFAGLTTSEPTPHFN